MAGSLPALVAEVSGGGKIGCQVTSLSRYWLPGHVPSAAIGHWLGRVPIVALVALASPHCRRVRWLGPFDIRLAFRFRKQ